MVPRYDTLKKPLFYKLNKPMPIAPEDNLQQRIENEEKIKNCATLLAKSSDDLQDLFPKSDEVGYHRLHVIVKFPMDDSNDQPPCKKAHLQSPVPRWQSAFQNSFHHSPKDDEWLLELHEKLWKRQDLRSKVFHTVNLTYSDYENLEKCLSELYPDRQEKTYQAKMDGARSVKLDFLNSLPSINASNDNDDGDDIDDELHSLFPTTLEYLDLHSLGLKKLPPRMPSLLLIRQEYKVLSEMLDGLPTEAAHSTLITGQPGTGKTSYLYLHLVKCMIAGTPCLFQTFDGPVYHVSEFITEVRHWSGEPIIAICNANGDTSQPPQFILQNEKIQMIAASSPDAECARWLGKMSTWSVKKFFTKLWSPQELVLTGLFLHCNDLVYSRLQEATAYFGFNPRNCFYASSSPLIFTQIKATMLNEICRVSLRIRDFRSLFDDFSTTSSLYSGFEMSPKDDQRLLAEAQIAAVSPWALDNLFKRQLEADVSYNAYRSIMKAPKMGILRGQMFERQVLKFFAGLKENMPFRIRSLDDSMTSHWVYPGPTSCSSFYPLTFIQLLEVAVTLKKPLCLTMPNPLNFPAVASILYDPSQGFTGIQITSQTTHPVVVMGFKQIQKLYSRLVVGLGSSIPLGTRWRFIFVVPDDIAASFTKQPLGGGGTDNQGWLKSVDQYVLGLKEDMIWLKT